MRPSSSTSLKASAKLTMATVAFLGGLVILTR
jgi:hypothetical protein